MVLNPTCLDPDLGVDIPRPKASAGSFSGCTSSGLECCSSGVIVRNQSVREGAHAGGTMWYVLDLRALGGFERCQCANIGLPLGSVKYTLGSIDGVEASRVEVVLD